LALTDILDIPAILALPWSVLGVGLVLIGFFLLRAVSQFFTLHPIRAVTSVVYALIIALVLSRFGGQIAAMIESPPPVVQ